MNLFKNEDILEKKYRLKYKYLIETEPLIIEILKDDSFKEYVESPSNSTLSKLFNNVFEAILNAANPYTSYLDIKYHNSYNITTNKIYSYDEQTDTKYRCELYILYEMLKNHCIINGYIFSLHSSDHNAIALRGMYDYYNKQPESVKAKYKHSADLLKKHFSQKKDCGKNLKILPP